MWWWRLVEGQMEAGRSNSGALWQERYCLTCQLGVLVALVSCWHRQCVWPAVLISLRCFFSPLFLSACFFIFWLRCQFTPDHTQRPVGQPAVSVTNCHRHCLSSLTGWTDDGHLNGSHHSTPTSRLPQHIEETSIFIVWPTHLYLFQRFDSFICKPNDKTYGVNLQQTNSDPSSLFHHSES